MNSRLLEEIRRGIVLKQGCELQFIRFSNYVSPKGIIMPVISLTISIGVNVKPIEIILNPNPKYMPFSMHINRIIDNVDEVIEIAHSNFNSQDLSYIS